MIQRATSGFLLAELKQLMVNANGQLVPVVKVALLCTALFSNRPLKIVLAIDEASSCPAVI
jgi:hypothetical protein